MSEVSPLTLDLIAKQPQTAVSVFEGMDPSDVAAFFEALPSRFAATLIAKTSVLSASRILCDMEPSIAAAILSGLDYQTAVSIMRVVPETNQEALLAALPKKMKTDLRATLTYPPDTVGAKMSPNIVIMTGDQNVGEALKELRQLKRAKLGSVYVVNEARKLVGSVAAEDLLQLSSQSPLGDIMDTSVPSLSARARLSSVRSLPAWDDYSHLPVINRQKYLVGTLARRTFRQKVTNEPAFSGRSQSILSSVASAFLSSCLGLAQTLTDIDVAPGNLGNDTAQKTQRGASR